MEPMCLQYLRLRAVWMVRIRPLLLALPSVVLVEVPCSLIEQHGWG
jgi:hypothetical protein